MSKQIVERIYRPSSSSGAIPPTGNRRLRILVENGTPSLTNMGDVAMLQVLVSRIRRLCPDASIEVVTNAPELLLVYCPDAMPVSARGRKAWFNALLGDRIHQFLPRPVSYPVRNFERTVRCRWPSLAHAIIQSRMKLRQADGGEVSTYLDALFAADLVLLSGGGDINDTFRDFAMTLLDVLTIAFRRGIRTAVLGQGFGPIGDESLIARAKAVLPFVDIICSRESRAGVPLLHSLGVSPERIITTGDDAIELAYEARPRESGTDIGVNLRIADYSEVDSGVFNEIRPVLHNAARKHRASLIPLPIARHDCESDLKTIRQLLAGYDDTSDGGASLNSPFKVIKQTGRCRVVVTGSYHAGVFALSQGIPVVGLVKSPYYFDKFFGLAAQFGTGCQVVRLDDEKLGKKLAEAIDVAWGAAEHVRPALLEAAKKQIEIGQNAYQLIPGIMSEECRAVGATP